AGGIAGRAAAARGGPVQRDGHVGQGSGAAVHGHAAAGAAADERLIDAVDDGAADHLVGREGGVDDGHGGAEALAATDAQAAALGVAAEAAVRRVGHRRPALRRVVHEQAARDGGDPAALTAGEKDAAAQPAPGEHRGATVGRGVAPDGAVALE